LTIVFVTIIEYCMGYSYVSGDSHLFANTSIWSILIIISMNVVLEGIHWVLILE